MKNRQVFSFFSFMNEKDLWGGCDACLCGKIKKSIIFIFSNRQNTVYPKKELFLNR